MTVRVLVVDDSAYSRSRISTALEEHGCEIVGQATDGRSGFRLALELSPDVITCDLEMPNMDGFTFLRLMNSQSAIPMIVVTTNDRPEAALQALELGARDFIVKDDDPTAERSFAEQLYSKVEALAKERPAANWEPADLPAMTARELVVIGASTGGPRAIHDIFRGAAEPKTPVVIAQHMPAGFTEAFAARLRRVTGFDFAEAKDQEVLAAGAIRIIPGGCNATIARRGEDLVVSVEKNVDQRWTPSVDLLFASASETCGARVLGVVLTGMGDDGAKGTRTLCAAGGSIWCESPATSVIDGMPSAALAACESAKVAPLDELALRLGEVMALCRQ